MVYTYETKGTCAKKIYLDIEDDIIKEVRFIGGCSGNTQGIAALVRGMKVQDVIEKCQGIDCAGRGTSCPDQLAKALQHVASCK